MQIKTPHRQLVRARLAVCMLFASFGVVLSTWAVHLPALRQATGMSTSMMGTVLLILGVGSLVGMQLTGIVIDRFGPDHVAVLAGVAMAASMPIPLAGRTITHAMVAAVFFGIATGAADVAMNAAAVGVERDFGRPIMAAFHAVFSIGTVIGSLLGAAGFALRVNSTVVITVIAFLCIVAVGCAAAGFRGGVARASAAAPSEAAPQRTEAGGRHRRRVLLLGVLAFLLLLSEGSAMDWASLHAQQHLGAPPSLGAVAVGSFLAAMTVCRLTVDRVVGRLGAVWVLGGGAMLGAVGLSIVIVAHELPLVFLGWVLCGLGLGGGVPQVLTAAGNIGEGRSGRTLARVVGVGYVAILAGPAIIGWLVELVSWTGALLVPLCALLLCALAASTVTPNVRVSARSV